MVDKSLKLETEAESQCNNAVNAYVILNIM